MGQASSSTSTTNVSSSDSYKTGVKKYEFVSNQSTNLSNQVGVVPPRTNVNVAKPKFKAVLKEKNLLDAFKTFSIEGRYLNHMRFDDTIESLFSNIDIPSMHYTYLSEKIYNLLDESKDGKISEDEFMNGMKNVIKNREFRLKLSMMAMMSTPQERNYIEFKEIVEFFFKSWVYGYKHLGWEIKRDKNLFIAKSLPAPTITQLELWANKFENHIRIFLVNDFRECGIDANRPIDFETFKKWIYKDHNLKLTYTFKNVVIATSLVGLDELGFEESPKEVTITVNQNYFQYPSFGK